MGCYALFIAFLLLTLTIVAKGCWYILGGSLQGTATESSISLSVINPESKNGAKQADSGLAVLLETE